MFNNAVTTTSTSGSYSNHIVWSGNTTGSILGIDPSYYPISSDIGTTTGQDSVISTSKRCRDCHHAHLNNQCVDFQEWGAVTFVKCTCKEYVPKDNLEFLEHLYDKKQRKENPSSL